MSRAHVHGGNVVPQTTNFEHQVELEAKRVLPVDAFGGIQTEGNMALKTIKDGSDIYVCQAQIGATVNDAVWQVQKISIVNGDVTILWAGGTDAFNNNIGDVTALEYA